MSKPSIHPPPTPAKGSGKLFWLFMAVLFIALTSVAVYGYLSETGRL